MLLAACRRVLAACRRIAGLRLCATVLRGHLPTLRVLSRPPACLASVHLQTPGLPTGLALRLLASEALRSANPTCRQRTGHGAGAWPVDHSHLIAPTHHLGTCTCTCPITTATCTCVCVCVCVCVRCCCSVAATNGMDGGRRVSIEGFCQSVDFLFASVQVSMHVQVYERARVCGRDITGRRQGGRPAVEHVPYWVTCPAMAPASG